MLLRRSRALSGTPLAAAAATSLLLSGCAGVAQLAADPSLPAERLARPVADLSGAQFNPANFFMGLGISHLRPEGSSLDSGWGYDLNMAVDVPAALTLEVLVGLWDVPDRPDLLGGGEGDSTLEMVPVLVAVQLQKEFDKYRAYVAGGAGYSFNNYALGGRHRTAMLSEYSADTYSAEADDAAFLQGAVGAEFYSSDTADLNFALELRYVWGDVDLTEIPDGVPHTRSADVALWLIRANITWHF